MVLLNYAVVFTPHDERSQGEHPHNSLRSRDCTSNIIYAVNDIWNVVSWSSCIITNMNE